jgi:hypothetical protein
MPYPLPAHGAPLRVAFAGPSATFAAHAMHDAVPGVQPRFVDVRAGVDPRALRALLADAAPHVVIALAPELLARGAFAGLRAAVIAVVAPDAPAPDPGSVDRILRTPGPGDGPRWRACPLPVDDRLYAPVRSSRRPPRALCVGRSTEHREWVLTPAKHAHDVVHYAHGLVGVAFGDALAAADIGIALHPAPVHGFPPQALLHLAAGQLLLSERLAPACGLEAGIDFLEIDSRDALVTLLTQLRRRPDSYERVRVRGRLKAEQHRASRVWPRIVRDLLQDLSVFGTARTLQG